MHTPGEQQTISPLVSRSCTVHIENFLLIDLLSRYKAKAFQSSLQETHTHTYRQREVDVKFNSTYNPLPPLYEPHQHSPSNLPPCPTSPSPPLRHPRDSCRPPHPSLATAGLYIPFHPLKSSNFCHCVTQLSATATTKTFLFLTPPPHTTI